MNISSRISVSDDILQVDLAITDLTFTQFVQSVCNHANEQDIIGCIINVSEIEIFLQSDIDALTRLVRSLELCGYRVLVCGFDPLCAALIYSYIEELPFLTELNPRYAYKALQNQR